MPSNKGGAINSPLLFSAKVELATDEEREERLDYD
jgi:hypothetical protein